MIKKIIKRIFVAIILLPIILLLLGVIYFHIDPFEYEILTDTTVELNAKEDVKIGSVTDDNSKDKEQSAPVNSSRDTLKIFAI